MKEPIVCDYCDGDQDSDNRTTWSYDCRRHATRKFTLFIDGQEKVEILHYCDECASRQRAYFNEFGPEYTEEAIPIEVDINAIRDKILSEKLTQGHTNRGFGLIEFTDHYNIQCSLQKSSLASEDCIWLGVDDTKPKILASDTPEGGTGWRDYTLPEGVHLTTHMHLTQEMVAALLPALQHFAETGELLIEE